ncbi:DUF192 domain-containing protein [Clostridium sp. chh4-2]|uniref:DUF192 domain-containing protein n=1 Tax=Clostridium sp. chh4-2 TaxID=2067550 RepID=UPI0015E1A4FF|nr:DUF192 domain-containing protein [Clostridium sp. chh4-2]
MGYRIRYENDKEMLLENVKTADNFMTRLAGLMGRKRIGTEEGLLLKKVSCIHTCFMRFPICTVYLDSDYCVIDSEVVKPWRCGKFCRGAVHVLEMHESKWKDIRPAEKLVLEDDGRERRT